MNTYIKKKSNLISVSIIIGLLVFLEILLAQKLMQNQIIILTLLAGLIFIAVASTRLIDVTLYALILTPPILAPLVKIKYDAIYPLEFCIGILVILWLFKLLTSKTLYPRDIPLLRPFMALALIGIISTLNSYIFWDLSVITTHRSLLVQLADIALKTLPISLIFLAYLISNSHKKIEKFHKIFLGLGFLYLLAFMLQLHTRVFPFGNIQAISIFSLAFATLLFCWKNLSPLKRNILSLLALGLFFVITRTAHLATLACLLVSILAISLVRSRKLFAVLLIILIVFSFFVPSFWVNLYKMAESEGSLARIPMAISAFEIFKKHPILGVGPANYYSYTIAQNVGWEFWRTPMPDVHNNYLQTLVEYGILGLIAFLWLIIKIVKDILTSFQTVSDSLQKAYLAAAIGNFAGFVVMSVAGAYLFPGVHSGGFIYFNRAAYMWILVGIALSLPKLINNNQENTESENIND